MELLEPFEDKALVQGLARHIATLARERPSYTLMEVCGTHTQAIGQWGLRSLLPDSVHLVSGPGCPVCVTPGEYIDNACRLALEKDAVLASFGDLIRVPGVSTSLESAEAEGAEIHMLYSPRDALELANSTGREVIFLAIGFETTIAGIAATMMAAHKGAVANLSFYTSLRLVPPALDALLHDPEIELDGFLLPGHVSVIIGPEGYNTLVTNHVPGAIAGFEPVDILHGIEALCAMLNKNEGGVRNLYPRVVRPGGNPAALALFAELFEPADIAWRGLGTIPASGYRLREPYAALDAEKRFALPPVGDRMPDGCRCGQVLKGQILPDACPLFGEECTPHHPVGPCMVSDEGSCAATYRYR